MNMKKFDKKETIRLIKHCKRISVNSRSDIDFDRTQYNMNLYKRNISEEEYMAYRLQNVKIWGRNSEKKKIIYSCDWVLTAPQEIQNDYDECIRFFQCFTEFCAERYGKNNAIGSYVHFDEETPHVHFMFMPILFDEKNNREKLCASDLMKKRELYSFHEDFQQYLYENNFNFRVVNENKRERLKSYQNRSIEQLKYDRDREWSRNRWE